jgi:hypothetical protein
MLLHCIHFNGIHAHIDATGRCCTLYCIRWQRTSTSDALLHCIHFNGIHAHIDATGRCCTLYCIRWQRTSTSDAQDRKSLSANPYPTVICSFIEKGPTSEDAQFFCKLLKMYVSSVTKDRRPRHPPPPNHPTKSLAFCLQ